MAVVLRHWASEYSFGWVDWSLSLDDGGVNGWGELGALDVLARIMEGYTLKRVEWNSLFLKIGIRGLGDQLG